jgi:hypothetical protein
MNGTALLDLSGVTALRFADFLSGDLTRYGAFGRRWDAAKRVIDDEGYGLEAEVTVSEDHEDDLAITQHPVEYGAAITDHSYKQPPQVRVRVGWSNAYVGDVTTVYEDILALQQERRPFTIYTGKRFYENMLISSIRTQTNSGLEYSFVADVTFQQIILVSTQTISVTSNLNDLGFPERNQPTIATGSKQTTPATLTSKQQGDAGADIVL